MSHRFLTSRRKKKKVISVAPGDCSMRPEPSSFKGFLPQWQDESQIPMTSMESKLMYKVYNMYNLQLINIYKISTFPSVHCF